VLATESVAGPMPLLVEDLGDPLHRGRAHQRHESPLAMAMSGAVQGLHRPLVLQEMLDGGGHRSLPGEAVPAIEHGGRLLSSQERHRPQHQTSGEHILTERLEPAGREGIALAQERQSAVHRYGDHGASMGGARAGTGTVRSAGPVRPRSRYAGRSASGRNPDPRGGSRHIAAEGPAPCYLDPMIENSKLTVIGAGAVGSSVAYAALIRGSARHITLYDIAAEKTEAEVLDLAHGTLFTGSSEIDGGSDIAVA